MINFNGVDYPSTLTLLQTSLKTNVGMVSESEKEESECDTLTKTDYGDVPAHFDFTNMTRKEAISAAFYLFDKGMISEGVMGGIVGAAVTYTPDGLYGEHSLDSPLKLNWVEEIKAVIGMMRQYPSKGVESYEAALEALTTRDFDSELNG